MWPFDWRRRKRIKALAQAIRNQERIELGSEEMSDFFEALQLVAKEQGGHVERVTAMPGPPPDAEFGPWNDESSINETQH